MNNNIALIKNNASLIAEGNNLMKEYVAISIKQNEEKESFLSDLEKEVLILRFGLFGERPHTIQEIGEILLLSNERVRQIEKHTLNKIRKNIRIDFNKFNKKDYLRAVSYLINTNHKSLLDKMPYEEAAILLIKNGAIYGIILKSEEIAELLDMDVDKVNECYGNALRYLEDNKRLMKIR